MPAFQDSSLLPPPPPLLHRPPNWIPPIQAHPPPPAPPQASEPPRMIFTRQLWQRNMPEDSSEQGVSTRSHSHGSIAAHSANTNISRRPSSNVSTRSLRRASSPSGGKSKTPLTPEESPPFRSARKRNASIVEEEDKEIESSETSPVHTRASSGDSAAQVCICQPDPKIPRPRNAFILYRQHHQAKVVSQNPGLANPEISKIIGEQWRNQPVEVKNEWKALAEEEKLRHQQQYPTYRYQPKRNGRRNSLSSDTPGSANGEKPRCHKCGGRTILAPSTPYSHASDTTSPSTAGLPPGTPGSAPTAISRTLPGFRDLSLQSPAARRMRQYTMSPNNHHLDERDEVGPLSPETKRRRFNGEHPAAVHRAMPPRYAGVPPGAQVGPGTPFPFGQPQPQHHPFQPANAVAVAHNRRESLPGLRGMVSPPGPMAPPPRPGMGYQQHRLSQGHIAPDRSLTLPPLQTATANGGPATAKATPGKTVEEIVMDLPFQYKLSVLRKITPPKPLSKDAPRGPLIAVEGDDAHAVRELAKWLKETLGRDSELSVKLLESPDLTMKSQKEDAMAEYHMLAAQWQTKSKDIWKSLEYGTATTPKPPTSSSSREVDENYEDAEMPTPTKATTSTEMQVDGTPTTATSKPATTEAMDVDPTTTNKKSISILPLFSLHASNTFACRIPLDDAYSPGDHWQWCATQWRRTAGPDLTIFLRDEGGEKGKLVEQVDEERLFVVRRVPGAEGSGALEVDGATLRRVGFEVGEWVRAFGGQKP